VEEVLPVIVYQAMFKLQAKHLAHNALNLAQHALPVVLPFVIPVLILHIDLWIHLIIVFVLKDILRQTQPHVLNVTILV
jgi:hypothetical protein